MLIIALVLAVIGLAALVFAVITSNELVAWVCIGASVLGVVLLIIDALRERQRRESGVATQESGAAEGDDAHGDDSVDHPAEALDEGLDEGLDEADEPPAPADSESDAEAVETVSDERS